MPQESYAIPVGVIGAGAIGALHARNLHSKVAGARVAAIMDTDLARAEQVAVECGSAPVFRDARELIRDEDIEAVVIASPDATHAELALECIRSKKPVLCEKPLATNLEDAQEIVSAETGVERRFVQVGFVRRFDAQHLGLKQRVDSGAIGRPLLYRGWHRNIQPSPDVSSSETVLFNSAVHDLDAARWFLNQEIEEVFVRGINTDKTLGENVFDLQLLQLSLTGGCLATIEVYLTCTYGYEVGVEIVGERGTALIGPSQSPVVRTEQRCGVHVEKDWSERFIQGYLTEMEAWIATIKGDDRPVPTAWDGYISLRAAEGCAMSLRSGHPHRLPPCDCPALYHRNAS